MEPVTATPVQDCSQNSHIPGAYRVDPAGLITYVCPCGCGYVLDLPFYVGEGANKRGWAYSEQDGKPTLTPSIRRMDRCRFHGFLTAGIWTFCGDSGQGRSEP